MWPSWPGWHRMAEHLDLVFVGLTLAVVGAITSGFGMNLMKASNRFERDRPWYRRTRMLVGMSLACWVNTLLDVVAFALTPLALVAPIGGVTIVAATLFARCGWTGEPEYVVWQQWVAIGCVVTGVGVVAVCGPHPDPVLNTTEVMHHFHDVPFVAYQTMVWTAVVLCLLGLRLKKIGPPKLETTLATGATAGLCSGITQTMMKTLSVCVADFFLTGYLPFFIPEFWLAITELIAMAIILFYLLQVCLASAPLSLSTPLYMVSVILFTIIAGSAFYGDLEVATKAELVLFATGVGLVMTGMGVLIAYREKDKEERLLPGTDAAGDKAPTPQCQPVDETAMTAIIDPDPDL
jgi:hypothetical protein